MGAPSELSGDIFLDGSVFEGDWPHLSAAGWAVVALYPFARQPCCIACGPLIEHLLTINEAELTALCFALRHALPGSRFHTDSGYVWKGLYKRGQVDCSLPLSLHAFLWREVWRLILDRGEPLDGLV